MPNNKPIGFSAHSKSYFLKLSVYKVQKCTEHEPLDFYMFDILLAYKRTYWYIAPFLQFRRCFRVNLTSFRFLRGISAY